MDAVTLLPTFRRLRAACLLATGDPGSALEELRAALADLDEHGAHERGFILADLAAAAHQLGEPDAQDIVDLAQLELSRMGVRPV